jgi:hypothetical protein
MPDRKALLLRVGIDRGTGGALSPIFPDGSFEYIPIPETEPTRSAPAFASLPSRHGRSLAEFVPRRIAGRAAHIDPDFDAFTYGDAARHKRLQLLRLRPKDLLVFYAGFQPWPAEDIARLFAIGWLEVKETHDLSAARIGGDRNLRRRFGKTAHFLRDPPDARLALIEGEPQRSRLLDRALPLGDGEDRLLPDLAAFGYQGSLRRAVGHWLAGPSVAALEDWLRLGPVSLIGAAARLFAVPAGKVQAIPAGHRRADLAITDTQATIGDWVYSRDEDGAFILARINEHAETGEARAALYWCMRRLAPAARRQTPIPDPRSLPHSGAATARRLVSWTASRYRIGIHSA